MLSDKVIDNILCERTKVYLSSDVGSINIKKHKNELEIGTRFTYKDYEYKESSSKAVLMAIKEFDTKCRVRSMS